MNFYDGYLVGRLR